MKKFIALLLSLTLIISAFSTVGAFALEDTPTVDKSELYTVLRNGPPVGGRYTPESLEAFEIAREQAQAVYDDPNATQEQVDKAVKDIEDAIDNIQVAEVDVTKLGELLDSASYYFENKDKYTTISFKAFKDAFGEAQAQYYLGNLQSEIDSAYNDLDTAIKNLVLITDTAGVFKEYVDSRKPITKNRTYVYTELTHIGEYKVVYGGYSEKRTNNYSKYVGGYCFKLNRLVSPDSLAIYLVKNDEVIFLEEAFRDGLVPDMKVVVDAFNSCQYKDDMVIEFVKNEKSLKQKIEEKFGDVEVKDYRYIFTWNQYDIAYASGDTENKECSDNFGDYKFTSTITSTPYDMGIYCVSNEKAYTLIGAYENDLISDIYPILRTLSEKDSRYSYVNTNPTIESEFYEYAGLSKSSGFFEIIGETEDYKVCCGGSDGFTCLYYSHVIGEYEFISPAQAYPYDLALFIYKDGAFKKLHQSYLDGDIDIDEVVGLIKDFQYVSNNIKPLIKIEIGKIGDYTLYYKGLQVNGNESENINLGDSTVRVKGIMKDNMFSHNYGSTVLGLYLEDNNGNTTDLQSAYDTGLITDAQAVANMLGDIENSSKYFDITSNTTNPTDPNPTNPTDPISTNPTDPTNPTDDDGKEILEEPQPVKNANPIKVKANTVTVKAKALKTKNVTKEALKITKAKGKVSVAITKITLKGKKVSKKIANKFSITSKGKLTMEKALAKGNYKITAKVVAKGSVHYKAKTLTKTFTVKVK
ncbi:MAG: FIVAR domain-containing protein [Oscillospiraceae bacterium]|nr:FIVAR domain-containing protein [Oscillospiraceae bacterium]